MTTIVLVGVASALAVFAITLKARARKPKKAEKWEKAQIVKRLLALSEGETRSKEFQALNQSRKAGSPRRRATAGRGGPSPKVSA